jgi:cytochrome b
VNAPSTGTAVRVWDLPTRLFHWALVLAVACSVVTVKLGGLWMDWHMRCGYAILALVLFRILWGFAGSRYARFASFVRRPADILGYLKGEVEHDAGHSPIAAVSVLALLGFLLLQGALGLFTNDGNFSEGPLAKFVTNATGELLSTVHRRGAWVLFTLAGLHIAAIVYYTNFRKVALVRPMITGDRYDVAAPSAQDDLRVRLRALGLFVVASALVAFVVTR